MANTEIAASIGTGGCFPFPTGDIAPGATVVVGRSPRGGAGNFGTLATYLGHTLDGYVVVRVHLDSSVEEWLPSQMQSFDSVVTEFVA